ncbi:MAG: carboxypeptidase regulatory-like domain-containing protein [Chrysiogenales bacterium]
MKIFKTIILLSLCTAAMMYSQTQTGNIYGTVIEPAGSGIPGVMVTLTSATAGKLTTITSETGQYRFIALPPAADYELKFEVEGLKTQIRKGIRITVGENATINATMELGQISESIEVIASAPVIDLRKTTQATNMTKETLQSLPTARDPWVILDKTPGLALSTANVGGNASGQQSSWDSRGENRANSQWNLDGVEVTDPTSPGSSGTYFDYDMFEEMQIQTAANDVTAIAGGVSINFVTKRGKDNLFGGGRFYWTDKSLQGTNLPAGLEKEGLSGNTINNILDYGFNVGGPIAKGKAWFWASYGVQDINNVDMHDNPDKTVLTTLNGKVNFNLSSHRLELYAMWSEKTRDNRKNNPFDTLEAARNQSGPSWLIKLQDEFSIGRDLLTSLKLSYYKSTYDLAPNGGLDKITYLDYDAGWRYNSGSWSNFMQDYLEGTLTFNYYTEKLPLGSHDIMVGLNIRTMVADQMGGQSNGMRAYVYDALTPAAEAKYSRGVRVDRQWVDNFDYNRFSAFFQDSISTGRLTLNLGLRYDIQGAAINANTVPGTNVALLNSVYDPKTDTYINANLPEASRPAVDVPTDLKFLSPRLGFVWDITGKGKTVVKGNFAIYGGVMNFDSTQGLQVPFEILTRNRFNWDDINSNQIVEAGELALRDQSNNYAWVTGDAANLVDPNLTQDKDMEFMLGLEQELMPELSVGVNYIHRKIWNQSWNRPYVVDGDGNERLVEPSDWTEYTFTQDGKEYTYWDTYDSYVYYTGAYRAENVKDFHVTYDGVDLTLKKAMADKWMLMASVSFQSSKRHYASQLGYTNYDPTDHVPEDLLDSTASGSRNSRWMVKLNGVYQLPWGINLGASLQIRDGYVFDPTLQLDTSDPRFWDSSNPSVLIYKHGSERYKTFSMLDLRLEKMFQISNIGRLFVSLDGFNILNSSYVLDKETSMNSSRFGQPYQILNPRVFRLGLRFDF